MDKQTEKRRKLAHVLSEISRKDVVCKMDLKTNTGYCMATINALLTELSNDGFIILNDKKNNIGLRKTSICVNPQKVVVGVCYHRMKLYGRLMTLCGEVIHSVEKELDEAHCDIADGITSVIESMLNNKYSLAGIGISVALYDNTSLMRVLALRFSVSVHIMDGVTALAMYYRHIVKKSNTNFAVLFMGKRIRASKVSEWCETIELGNLLSPIISAKKGRLIYDEVLSSEAVKHRMTNKYGKMETAFEATTMDADISFYSKQLQYALGELLLLVDKTIKPASIIVAGDYITDELVNGSIEGLGENVRAEVVSFGKGLSEKIEGACGIALNGLLYY